MNAKYLSKLLADLEGKKDDKGFVKIHIDVSRPLIVELLRRSPLADDPICPMALDAKSLADMLVTLETGKSEDGYVSVHESIWRSYIVKLLRLSEDTGKIEQLEDLLHTAMGIIANARGGWEGSPDRQVEWTEAANRWRDEYHDMLHSSFEASLETGLDRANLIG